MQASSGWPQPLDLVGLALIAILLVLGLARGLWWQMTRLIGVALAVLVARAIGGLLAERLQALFPGFQPRTAHGAAWGALFLITLFACALIGLAGQRLIQALRLDLANRLAGACAGAVTGLCLHVAFVVLVCQLAPAPLLGRYVAGTYSERLYGALGIRWPVVLAADAAREVDQVLEQSPRHVHPPGGIVR